MAAKHLAAVCGLYCGACSGYRAYHDNNEQRLAEMGAQRGRSREDFACDGCMGNGRLTKYCRDCTIRLCPKGKKDVTHCADCAEFPCKVITAFNNDGMRHHSEVLANIHRQREIGVQAWLKEQEERWQCPNCGAPSEWYSKPCSRCGTPQPRRLPSLPKDTK